MLVMTEAEDLDKCGKRTLSACIICYLDIFQM